MDTRRTLAGALALSVVGLIGSIEGPSSAAESPFAPELIAKGRELAAIGNCITCHTRRDGKPFAGARPLPTPFGTIYSTNITPDPATGIGRWSEADFRRAMREGVDPQGNDLYPAFPYDHFTRVTDDDIQALYAYFMTRDPVHEEASPNRLTFPMSLRSTVRLWKAAYFRPGVYQADPSKNAEWNRGAYLVEGLAHCGACHTPRNPLGAERQDRALDGGEAEGWHATALTRNSPAPAPWTVDELYAYLRGGRDPRHGTAAGPMADVTHNLSDVAEADVHAIAVYVASRMPERNPTSADKNAERNASGEGAMIFAGACAMCHSAAPTFSSAVVPLGVTTSVNAPDPRNAIRVIMEGLHPESGEKGAMMPGFAAELTDNQVAALVDYLRAHFTDRAPWNDVPKQIAATRQSQKEQE